MKKLLLASLLATASFAAHADAPELPDLTSKSQLEKVSNEFAVNFAHTAVAAPETDGLWGIEVGLVGGTTSSPKLSDLINDAGEDGSKFKTIYHAGLMARAHFPFDLFVELSVLPEKEISDVTVKNQTFGLGWNAGGFFNLPVDVAFGWNFSKADISFNQTINNASTGNTDVNSTIDFKGKSSVLWAGVSKSFLFFTPYLKAGMAKTESDAAVTGTAGTIFTFSNTQKETVSSSGGYLALGANLQFSFFKLGFEASQMIGVKSASAKLSLDF